MTTKKQKILLERLELYCKRLGVPVPRIVWTKKEMKKLDKFYRGPRHGRGVRGYCCKRINCIYIAYAKHHTLKDLEHTLLHELIHFRFPSLQHGPKFEAKIKESDVNDLCLSSSIRFIPTSPKIDIKTTDHNMKNIFSRSPANKLSS